MASASYPENLLYHPEHDWALVEGDEATLGITWYAQDSLGEVVFYDGPEVGAEVTKDEPYAEVLNEDPLHEGWLVKIRISDPSEAEALMDSAAYTASLE